MLCTYWYSSGAANPMVRWFCVWLVRYCDFWQESPPPRKWYCPPSHFSGMIILPAKKPYTHFPSRASICNFGGTIIFPPKLHLLALLGNQVDVILTGKCMASVFWCWPGWNEMYWVPTYKITGIPNVANRNSDWMTFQQQNSKKIQLDYLESKTEPEFYFQWGPRNWNQNWILLQATGRSRCKEGEEQINVPYRPVSKQQLMCADVTG